MQAQSSRVEIATIFVASIPSSQPRISPRTFVHCLNALYVNTQLLATNVVSLHLHLADQDKCPDDAPMHLSRLQLDLVEQTTTLRHHIGLLRGIPAPIQEWICYSELWRLPETAEAPAALTLLRDATDSLMELYESMLPWAAKQCDHAVSYYLLAGHLATLSEHWQALRIFIPPSEVSPA